MLAGWLEKAPIPWIDQFFVLANMTLILLVVGLVLSYEAGRSLLFADHTMQLVDPALVLPAFVVYEVVASLFIWWRKPLASGQGGWFLVLTLVFTALFYAISGGVGSIYFYPFVMVILCAALSLKTGAAALFILGTVAINMILGRILTPTTAWDANMAHVAMDESMVLLVLGGASLLFTAQLRRDAQAKQSALAEARHKSLLHEFGRRLAAEGPELARMHETILEVASLLPQTEMALVLLLDPPDHVVGAQHHHVVGAQHHHVVGAQHHHTVGAQHHHTVGAQRHPTLHVFASTSARHPVGERVADLEVPSPLQAVSGMGAGYATPLPSSFAGDSMRQVILLPLHLPTGEVMGALVCGRQSEQPLTPDEEEFALDLSVEAGLAIRYARLFAREQEHLERLQRLQELQMTYLLMVSHDMKTPLTVLTTLMPMLRQLPDLPDETRSEIMEAIDGNLTRLAWSINSRLMAAKLDSGVVELHPRPLDLASLIHQAVAEISSWILLKQQTVQVQATPDLPLVRADGSHLEHVITNLLVNATKFAPAESTILVTLQPTEEGMLVCVEDEGPGVPSEQREWLFERYHARPTATANGGTGLGLYICRAVVAGHGGRIWVEDRPGGGSRFCFTLPLVADKNLADESVNVGRASKESTNEESRLQDPGD
jgi:K+-sensing histidine kinase KdpD